MPVHICTVVVAVVHLCCGLFGLAGNALCRLDLLQLRGCCSRTEGVRLVVKLSKSRGCLPRL
jgi:hypothetical protein